MNTIYILLLCVCVVIIVYQSIKIRSTKKVGSIVINTSDPEKDIYSLEMDVPLGELDTKKRVIFDIKHV
jgi:hypothetical protein